MQLIDLVKTMPNSQCVEIESENYRYLGWVKYLNLNTCESLMVKSCYSYINRDYIENDVIFVLCSQMEGDKNAEQQTE